MSELTEEVYTAFYGLQRSMRRYYPARSLIIAMSPEAADQVRGATYWRSYHPGEPVIVGDPRLTGVEMRAEVRL